MKSHALLRTNVSLTTNLKLVVTSNYRLYLESIDSIPELSKSSLKKFGLNKNSSWDFDISRFWNKTPQSIAFATKYDSDVSIMYNDFSYQYDSLYYCGARNISNNKGYSEEFEYFAPLYIQKKYMPTHFIIFRIDGGGLMKMDRTKFKSEFLNKMKCVKVFDLTTKTDLGEFINKNFTNNSVFKDYPAEISFSEYYSSINGIKYPVTGGDGGYSTQHFMLDFKKEYYFQELQKEITKKFEQSGMIFSNIVNFNFLFDDTPATPTTLKKWSINRYVGFYFDELELATTISPTVLPSLKSDTYINRLNEIETLSGEVPFTNIETVNFDQLYINVEGMLYKVREIKEVSAFKSQKSRTYSNTFEDIVRRTNVTKYKIISNVSLEGKTIYNDTSNFTIKIVYENGENKILTRNGQPYVIADFDDYDLWIIEINNDYFKLIKNNDGVICVYTDHAFVQTETQISYYINDPDPSYRKTINTVLSSNGQPVSFKIYRGNFTDVKDFDNDIVETQFAKFEYELDSTLTKTDESKLYVTNLTTGGIDDFKFGSEAVYIPASSEYTANSETFRIGLDTYGNPTELNELWRKNPTFVKWGYMNSLCSNDYPYLLNNSVLGDPYNRSTNYNESKPIRVEKNLDYFLSINSNKTGYTHHSLHVQDSNAGIINTSFKFELDKYLGINYNLDYFSYFFGKKNEFFSGKIRKNVKKWSYFNDGTTSTNNTVFKGLKFYLKKVNSVSSQNQTSNSISNISVTNTNDLVDYKFSILLSNNEFSINTDPSDSNKALVTKRQNSLKWRVVEEFRQNKTYEKNSVVLWQDMIFETTNGAKLSFPSNPGKSNSFQFYNKDTIYWRPSITNNFSQYGGFKSVVFNAGKYYYDSSSIGTIDFWNPKAIYNIDDIVIYRNSYFRSKVNNNTSLPNFSTNISWENLVDFDDTSGFTPEIITKFNGRTSKWNSVKEWSPNLNYGGTINFKAVTHNQILYGTTQSSFNQFIFDTDDWIRLHSFVQDTNFVYGPSIVQNNTLQLNGEIYECVDNTSFNVPSGTILDNSLNDGIYVIINKKHKNILLNIYVNDNTMIDALQKSGNWVYVDDKVKNINRDNLYERLLYKFTAANILNLLDNPFESFGFSDRLKYVIIENDGSIKIYDANDSVGFKNLPYILLPAEKTSFNLKKLKKIMLPFELSTNILNPTKKLQDGLITTKRTINYYSDLPIANYYSPNQPSDLLYSQIKTNYTRLYRHSGQYSPIFKEIQLFKSSTISKNYKNFKFDTDLTDFGMTGELIVSKVNRSGSLLKLKNSNTYKSIYPMLDEFGYHVIKRFIFKSNWDLEYHYECVLPTENLQTSGETIVNVKENG